MSRNQRNIEEPFDDKDEESLELFFKSTKYSSAFNCIDEIIRRNKQIKNSALKHYLFLDKIIMLLDIFIVLSQEIESIKAKRVIKKYIKK